MVKPLLGATAVLLVVTIGVYVYRARSDTDRLDAPELLARRALTAPTVQEREKAALDLARSGPQALPHLRRVLAESDTPVVRAAVIEGLGGQRDWPSMPQLLDALEDDDLQVRGRAGVAVSRILGLEFFFQADDPFEQRQPVVGEMRACYEAMQKSPPPQYKN